MKDLTTGSITGHLFKTASYMLVGMVFQTLYVLVDLYWVSHLGTAAVAAVALSGNLMFIVLALTQMLGVGTTTLVSHAVGRKNQDEARFVFNQSQGLSVVAGVVFLIVSMALRRPYAQNLSADAPTAALAGDYLLWFIPALALQFGMVAMGAALRGTGHFRPGMVVQTITVVLNMILAPFLIFGWVTHRAFGVAGAALASFIAIAIGIAWLVFYFRPAESYLKFRRADWKPKISLWTQLLKIGLPAGAEFGLMSVYLLVVYAVSRPFGASAQAGFGIGLRIVQSAFLPVVALGFAVAPVAGQNFGARQADRVRDTFKTSALLAASAMLVVTGVLYFAAVPAVRFFSADPRVIATGAEYLRIVAWSFPMSGVIFVSSSMFQAMGNTIPSLVTSATRIVCAAIPTLMLARLPGFELRWVWYLSLVAVGGQLLMNLALLRREFRLRLNFAVTSPSRFPAPDPA